MTGFEPRTSGIESDHSTTVPHLCPYFLDFLQKGFTTLTSIPSFFREKMSQKKKSEFELLRHLCNLETELHRGRGRSSRQFTIDTVDLSKKLELK